jgi:hypothetical protein
VPQAEGWRVTGFVDMEVASAGDPITDLVTFAIEMAAHFPVSSRWWEPLFVGYGRTPDFWRFKLRLLARHEASLKCHGEARWPGTREENLRDLLAAEGWVALFQTRSKLLQ